jgi:hypothetical protein
MAANQAGIDFGGLVWRILETSFVTRTAGGVGKISVGQEKDDAA